MCYRENCSKLKKITKNSLIKLKSTQSFDWVLFNGCGSSYRTFAVARTGFGALRLPSAHCEPATRSRNSSYSSEFLNRAPSNPVLLINKNRQPQKGLSILLVAGTGFEPMTSRLWAWRATGLLHPAISPVRFTDLTNYWIHLTSSTRPVSRLSCFSKTSDLHPAIS